VLTRRIWLTRRIRYPRVAQILRIGRILRIVFRILEVRVRDGACGSSADSSGHVSN